MMVRRILSIQLFFLTLCNSFAWDNCTRETAMRCGNTCILAGTQCKCGDSIFGHKDQKWCCNNSTCTGKGGNSLGYWSGEGNNWIGAECTGRALSLTDACDQRCNFFEKDFYRNYAGVRRGFMPCNANATHLNITECVQEDKMRDGKYDCRNRADEEAFANSSSLLLDLEKY